VLDDFDRVLAQARRGSPEAFQSLHGDLVRPVAAYLRNKGVAEIEDVTSEVFLAVFTGLDGFAGSQAAFRSWVFTITHHRIADHWRREARTPTLTELTQDHDGGTTPAAEHGALDALGTARVHELLDTLTPDQRDVLLLRIVADLTLEQTAEVLDKPAGAVKSLQHRGLAALRKIVEREGVSP
jgi:RNA polymerase sigma-70 factor (ECF subfamily)